MLAQQRQAHSGSVRWCYLLKPGASRPVIQSLLKRGVELLQHGDVLIIVDSHNLASTAFKRERLDYALVADEKIFHENKYNGTDRNHTLILFSYRTEPAVRASVREIQIDTIFDTRRTILGRGLG